MRKRNTVDQEEEIEEESNRIKRDIERLRKLKNRELRILVESFYDMQKLRIAMGNRIHAYGKAGLLEYIDPEPALGKLKEAEKELEQEITEVVTKHPLWDAWFKGVKGIGPIMAAGIIAWRDDINKADTISAFWKYHGLAPGQGRKKGEKVDYNPKAKTHAYKVGMQLLKAKGHYAEIYYLARAKYEEREDIKAMHENAIDEETKNGKKVKKYEARGGPKSYKLHIHYMALRKMIKRFYGDTWVMWRTVEGYEVTRPYIFSKAAKQKGIAHEHYELPRTDKQIAEEENYSKPQEVGEL